MKKHDKILKKASKQFLEDDDENDFTWILFHDYTVFRNGKKFTFKNIKNQKEWDEAKRKAGFSSKPFERPYIINLGCNTKEETERVRTLLDKLIL